MKINDVSLALLFQRLLYPSGMIRERSCTVIAKLLNNSTYANSIKEMLAEWFDEQTMESLCVFPLLIFIRAKEENNQFELPLRSDIEKQIKAPSFLSWMLLNELYRESVPEFTMNNLYSENILEKSQEDEFFSKYARGFLPPIYMDMAEEIQRKAQVPFIEQWKGEWRKIVKNQEIEISTEPNNYRGREDEKHLVAFDTRMSEAYRSAYLRALAWAVDIHNMTIKDACLLATKTCPVDLELWHLHPSSVPAWFPSISTSSGTIDTSLGQIWSSIENLWNKRFEIQKDSVLAQCGGLIISKDSYINLEIFGIFQKIVGSISPNLREIIDWCKWENSIKPMGKSYLRFGGVLQPTNIESMANEFDDWIVLPATTRFHPVSTPRWQWWRVYRDFWTPSPILLNEQCYINVWNNEILYSSPNGPVGHWQDWTDGFAEQELANIPPATGEYLTISQSFVRDFEDKYKYRFCWIVSATIYHRKHKYDKFQTFSFEKQFGASSLIIP
jgi:hypothetical protein